MEETTTAMRRLSTGVPGLDLIMEGGFLSGGVYIVQGPPGSGKTILANQLCCHHASHGGTAIYFTLLSESHARMIGHLRRMAFFREDLVGDSLVYLSGYKVLEEDGMSGLANVLRTTILQREASLMIVDGLVTVGEVAGFSMRFKRFVHEVQAFATNLDCTVLLLSSSDQVGGSQAEHTIVDGIVELSDDLSGLRSLRHVQVRKMRGTHQSRGKHTVEINDQGLIVHPRFEAGLGRDQPRTPGEPRREFGIAELDRMLMGGVPTGSITMMLGGSGCGKTSLELQFLAAGATRGERGLYFGFYEHPAALLAKCRRIGIGLPAAVDAGTVALVWERPIEGVLDVLASRLIRQVRETGVTRLCIDGLHTLFRTVDFPERMRAVTAALAEQLESLGVTTVYTLETPELTGAEGLIRIPIQDLSALAHNVFVIRYVEHDGRFDRMLSILKMRDSDYDRTVRALRITSRGLELSTEPQVVPHSRPSSPAGSDHGNAGAATMKQRAPQR